MSNLKNGNVTCQFLTHPTPLSHATEPAMSILRKGHVAVSNLRFEGPYTYLLWSPLQTDDKPILWSPGLIRIHPQRIINFAGQ